MNTLRTASRLLLNADLGEGYGAWRMGDDAALMPYIDQANIACGMHAGDPLTLVRTIKCARDAGVSIGAHPAYPDLMGFGRRSMQLSEDELNAVLWYQMGALDSLCRTLDTTLQYVKPHGALNNDMMRQRPLLLRVLRAIADYHPQRDTPLPLMLPAMPAQQDIIEQAKALGVPLIFEAFADRRYTDDGLLQPRQEAGAVLNNTTDIVAQGLSLAQHQGVQSVTGQWLPLHADTLCVHGDNAVALAAAKALHDALRKSSL